MIPTVTEYIMERTSRLSTSPEMHQNPPGFMMFNTGSVEVEVGEFLFSLVRLLKPDNILETGTHYGLSALYMGLACERNQRGFVFTYEVLPNLLNEAQLLWNDLGISHRINGILQPSLIAQGHPRDIDLLFLDSEPGYRFDELLRFFPFVKPGGFIVIHDLDKNLGHHGQTYHNLYDWPYGYFGDKIGHLLTNHELMVLNPLTPRGLTVMQKTDSSFQTISYLKENSHVSSKQQQDEQQMEQQQKTKPENYLLEVYNRIANFHATVKGHGHGYIEAYGEELDRFSRIPVVFCEIGVQHGSSMRLWDLYFTHPKSVIYGVDFDTSSQLPELISSLSPRVQLLDFNSFTIENTPLEHQSFDCVIDDGDASCQMKVATFENFWPRMKPGGKLILENISRQHLPLFAELHSISRTIDQDEKPRPQEWGGGKYLPNSIAVVYTKD